MLPKWERKRVSGYLDGCDGSDGHDEAGLDGGEVVGGVGHARVVRHRRETEDGPDRIPAGADELGAPVEDVDLEVVDQEDAGQDLDRLEVVLGEAGVQILVLHDIKNGQN